jgi:hypothetical protein
MTAKTSQKLADALRNAGLFRLADRAMTDEFHDFLSPHATPTMILAQELANIIGTERAQFGIAARNIRQRVIDGDFDASDEEADEWASSNEAHSIFKRLVDRS